MSINPTSRYADFRPDLQRAVAALAVLTVAACSGSAGTGGGGGNTGPSVNYPGWVNYGFGSNAQVVKGVAHSRDYGVQTTVAPLTASYTPGTGGAADQFSVTVGQDTGNNLPRTTKYPDVFSPAGIGQPGFSIDPKALAASYTFVKPVRFIKSLTFSYEGVAGVETVAADMPTSGAATYLGVAYGQISTATPGGGNLVVDVNRADAKGIVVFGGTAQLGLVIDNFQNITNASTGQPASATITGVIASQVPISGNGFSGGVLSESNNGTTVNFTGADVIGGIRSVDGMFYGYDTANNIPDEIGGVMVNEGQDGAYYFIFVAD